MRDTSVGGGWAVSAAIRSIPRGRQFRCRVAPYRGFAGSNPVRSTKGGACAFATSGLIPGTICLAWR